MRGRHSWLGYLLGTLAMLAASGARAEGGRVTFAGRIVEATCSVGADLQAGAGADLATGRGSCGQGSNGRSYDTSRRALTGNESDPVLKYFNDYVRAGDAVAEPTLVVRVYE